MPVQFRRDELPGSDEDPGSQVVWQTDAGARLGGLVRGLGAGLWFSIPGAVGLWLGLTLMRRSLVASASLTGDSDFWREIWWSLLLFCFYGAVLGGGIAWRVSSAASLGGLATWLAAGANLTLVLLVGAFASRCVLFSGPVPSTCWMGLALLAAAALAGVRFFNAWSD